MKKFIVMSLLMIVSFYGQNAVSSETAPYRLKTGSEYIRRYSGDVKFISIQNISDSPITIKSITLNKGNCKYDLNGFPKSFPVELKYGEISKVYYDCDVLESEIEIDNDSWVHKF